MKPDQDVRAALICCDGPLRAAHVHIVARPDHDDMVSAVCELCLKLFCDRKSDLIFRDAARRSNRAFRHLRLHRRRGRANRLLGSIGFRLVSRIDRDGMSVKRNFRSSLRVIVRRGCISLRR